MTNLIKVKDHKDLVRDSYSKAIINTNTVALQEHRKRKELAKQSQHNSIRLNDIEQDVKNIKIMLATILAKLS